jgi:ankyrin repeat protein
MLKNILMGLVLISLPVNAVIDLNDSRIDKQALFYRAIEQNNIDLTELLLKSGVNVNQVNNQGYTSLHLAIAKNNLDIIKMLIKAGGNVNFNDGSGMLILNAAIHQRNIDIIQILLNAGAAVNMTPFILPEDDWEGNPLKYMKPLYFAISSYDDENKFLKITELLINAGADVNATFEDATLLMLSVYDSKKLELLIKSGADINARNNLGHTAFIYAVKGVGPHRCISTGQKEYSCISDSWSFEESIKLLVKAGANLHIKDNNGKTQLDAAFQIACAQGNLKLIEFLQSL